MSEEKKILFTITEEQLETGLRGYPCGYCPTSYVDENKGLFYVGQPVASLARRRPEEVMALLYLGREASAQELQEFEEELGSFSALSDEVIQAVMSLPRQGHPMKIFAAAMLILGMIEGTFDYRKDALRVLAKVPLLAAVVINHHAGWGPTSFPKQRMGYMERFTHMLNVPKKNYQELLHIFTLFNILHYDHGGGNLSVFVGKAVASGLEDLYGSLSACLCALAGPRHGRANQDALQLVEEVWQKTEGDLDASKIVEILQKKLAKGGLLFGFGHAVLRVEDPRATLFYTEAKKSYPHHPLVQTALILREVVPKVLQEHTHTQDPYPNVDAISGVLLSAAGFPYAEYFPVLFGMARVVGVAIQVVYERLEAKEGRGTPIVRPKYLYRARG
ncbi:MAG: citrate (Si)-synthase [Chlamydiae bacterium]|nr:citrate (Si)-synthase [Chlamydiota bacterium]